MTRAVCRLYGHFQVNEWDAAQHLKRYGFENVSAKFVQAICDQLTKQIQSQMKPFHENAEKSLFYTLSEVSGRRIIIWSSRYFLLFKQTGDDFHVLELIDMYNDKST